MNSRHLTKGDRQLSNVRKGKVRLYSNRFCPYSQRVILVLEAKEITYEIVNINLTNKPDWMFDKTPNGQIPALELDNGDVLYESIVVSDFLDAKVAHNSLHPKDPLRKAKDQILLREFTKVVNLLSKAINSGQLDKNDESVVAEKLNMFENELSERNGPFFAGAKPGMLDFMIWPWCERVEVLKTFGKHFALNLKQFPKLMRWRQKMLEQDIVRENSFSTSTHIQYLQSFRAGTPDYDQLIKNLV